MSVTVMLIDDDWVFLQATKAFFNKRSIDVITAYSHQMALNALKKETPDIIFLDQLMANHDTGFRLSYQIKHDMNIQVPIYLLSGVNSITGYRFNNEENELASWARIDGFLAKPITALQLLRTVKAQVVEARDIIIA